MSSMHKTYRVELRNGEDTPLDPIVYEVTVILADLLRGELEGPRHGITDLSKQPMHGTVLWLWSASVRCGHYAGGFQEFKAACLGFEVVNRPATDEVRAVPPTLPADTPLHSPHD